MFVVRLFTLVLPMTFGIRYDLLKKKKIRFTGLKKSMWIIYIYLQILKTCYFGIRNIYECIIKTRRCILILQENMFGNTKADWYLVLSINFFIQT